MRALLRLAALSVRVAVRDGKVADAIEWIQTGNTMARHVADGPILLQGLVGVSMSMAMIRPLEDMIQAPGAPSLFWALANRPRPLIDLTAGMDGERFLLEREIPQLRELDSAPWGLEKARSFGEELRTRLFRLSGYAAQSPAGKGSPAFEEWTSKLGLAALVAQAYPGARAALIAEGRTAAQVDAMPTVQLASLHTFQSYQRMRDDVFKWVGVPYHQAHNNMKNSADLCHVQVHAAPLLRLFSVLMTAVDAVQMAQLRLDRQLDAIQCIEAVRMYGATHGRFPARLQDITDAPAPLDPATGRPFDYRLDGDHAVLSAPAPPGLNSPRYRINYVLKWTR